MADKQSRIFYFKSPDCEATEAIEKDVITHIWLFWIPSLEKLPRVEGMEESIDIGGFPNLSLLDSSLKRLEGKWGEGM